MELLHHNISSYGGGLDELIFLISAAVGFWFTLALLTALYFTVSSIRKDGVKAAYIKGEGWNQTKWIMIPVVLVTLCDVAIDVKTHHVWDEIKGKVLENPEKTKNSMEIGVKMFQFGFLFSYDKGKDGKFFTEDDKILEPYLRIPAGKNIIYHLTSADVIHNFFVRNFRLKQDAIPGRFIMGWFRVEPDLMKAWRTDGVRKLEAGAQPAPGTKVITFDYYQNQRIEVTPFENRKPLGDNWASAPDASRTFEIVCSQICGRDHGNMFSRLIVDDESHWQAWMANEKKELGEE